MSWFWISFFVGQVIHVLLQAEASVRASSNGIETVRHWLSVMWIPVIGRVFLCSVAMALWLESPALFSKGLAVIAINFLIPMNYATTALFGYVSDSFLDKLGAIIGGRLNVDIPKVVPPPRP